MSGTKIGALACSLAKRNSLFCNFSSNKLKSVRYLSVTNTLNMKYVQFVYKNKPDEIRAGYLEGDNVVDISKHDSSLPTTLIEILKSGGISKVNK